MADQHANPFDLSVSREKLRFPAQELNDFPSSGFTLKKPTLDVRAVRQSAPTLEERGLTSATKSPSNTSTKIPASTISPATQRGGDGTGSNSGSLSKSQSTVFFGSVRRASLWLPKARKEWDGFINALQSGKPLPAKVTNALKVNFGWINNDSNNNNLPPIPAVVDRLLTELNTGLPVTFQSIREESPYSTKRNPRWVRARPLYNDDDLGHGLVLYPDFFETGGKTASDAADARAKTVIHEVLHTWEKTGGWNWSDTAQEDQHKEFGGIRKYLANPSSYAGLIHDLAQ